MKLKTIKDLRGEIGKPSGIDKDGNFLFMFREEDLKQEAIKWVKMLREKRKGLTSPTEIAWNEGRQLLMEEFFNITEEDLK